MVTNQYDSNYIKGPQLCRDFISAPSLLHLLDFSYYRAALLWKTGQLNIIIQRNYGFFLPLCADDADGLFGWEWI